MKASPSLGLRFGEMSRLCPSRERHKQTTAGPYALASATTTPTHPNSIMLRALGQRLGGVQRRGFSVKAIHSTFPTWLTYYSPHRHSTLFDHEENESRLNDIYDQGVVRGSSLPTVGRCLIDQSQTTLAMSRQWT
ncbi:hypothetical protein L249_1261 [Ophiocordyceps polyrhachis-furcata BCC 54312]|uniref:Uncharacterized protein n=1 Tax=Ophiocordyceps polyrhachis-furcata BCC 54312 TaxID=1330021 RepID=A0A367LCB9_9HYPO|nr:hypothetical protein L249_1261 [Ophiocordyceps polyrhachis-furcata BCC 54312]